MKSYDKVWDIQRLKTVENEQVDKNAHRKVRFEEKS